MMSQRDNPKFVLISDVHYSLNTLSLADTAFRAAIDKASELNVPLVDAGDLTNDKAIIRGEVANTLIKTMLYARAKGVQVFCLVGNHSLINEKGAEHALHFLEPYCTVIDSPVEAFGVQFIPYQNNAIKFLELLATTNPDKIVIAHQGTIGGYLGDYVKDSSAFDPTLSIAWKAIFLGHYHRHYVLHNTVSIGNPYTLTFGEANDGPKGFLVVNENGSFTREILELRKHAVFNVSPEDMDVLYCNSKAEDLTWVKLHGRKSQLDEISKEMIAKNLGHSNFKLDKISDEPETPRVTKTPLTTTEVLDSLIDNLNESTERKENLKQLWKRLVS